MSLTYSGGLLPDVSLKEVREEMKKQFVRRDRVKIYGDILSAIWNERESDQIVLTRIQLKTNVPFDRLKAYLTELKELDLVQDEPTLRLSKKGQEFISEYKKVLDFMERMGLGYSRQSMPRQDNVIAGSVLA